MLTLSLLRHAKSSWAEPGLDDHERPLAKRGAKAASAMGAFMASRGLTPDLVLCSDAARARATLALVLRELAAAPQVVFDDRLYHGAPATLLARLNEIETGPRHVLLIGHNPGLQALALELIGDGEKADIAALAAKFPTCALAVLTFETSAWLQVRAGAARLVLYMTPRRLP
jgi:phosphohistidine phosphatase